MFAGQNQNFRGSSRAGAPDLRQSGKVNRTMLPQAQHTVTGTKRPGETFTAYLMLSNRGYAVTDPEERFASGRAEEDLFFYKKFA